VSLSCPLLSLRWRCRPQINVEASEADSFGSGWIGSAHEESDPFSSLGILSTIPASAFQVLVPVCSPRPFQPRPLWLWNWCPVRLTAFAALSAIPLRLVCNSSCLVAKGLPTAGFGPPDHS
jgi:hypothetical protein